MVLRKFQHVPHFARIEDAKEIAILRLHRRGLYLSKRELSRIGPLQCECMIAFHVNPPKDPRCEK